MYGVYCENLLFDTIKFEPEAALNKDAELHKLYTAKFIELQNQLQTQQFAPFLQKLTDYIKQIVNSNINSQQVVQYYAQVFLNQDILSKISASYHLEIFKLTFININKHIVPCMQNSLLFT